MIDELSVYIPATSKISQTEAQTIADITLEKLPENLSIDDQVGFKDSIPPETESVPSTSISSRKDSTIITPVLETSIKQEKEEVEFETFENSIGQIVKVID